MYIQMCGKSDAWKQFGKVNMLNVPYNESRLLS